MTTPKHLKVFGKKYKLKHLQRLARSGLYGLCDTEKEEIQIDSKLEDEIYWETILHELFHAVCHETSLQQAFSPDLEEVLVDLLSKSVVHNFDLKHKKKKPKKK